MRFEVFVVMKIKAGRIPTTSSHCHNPEDHDLKFGHGFIE
jgi:hypothetical protein